MLQTFIVLFAACNLYLQQVIALELMCLMRVMIHLSSGFFVAIECNMRPIVLAYCRGSSCSSHKAKLCYASYSKYFSITGFQLLYC